MVFKMKRSPKQGSTNLIKKLKALGIAGSKVDRSEVKPLQKGENVSSKPLYKGFMLPTVTVKPKKKNFMQKLFSWGR
tara:strand:- start:43 stop:273 length:231 start_codon:yes stop_codon:yes gene_type:complete